MCFFGVRVRVRVRVRVKVNPGVSFWVSCWVRANPLGLASELGSGLGVWLFFGWVFFRF